MVVRRILLSAFLALLAAPLAVTAASPASADAGTAEAQFLDLLNATRAQHGRAPLARDGALDALARDWSAYMASACGLCHRPDLGGAVARIEAAWERVGENVGRGGDVVSLTNAFISSSGHFANMIGDYNRVGIGVVERNGRLYVTFDFLKGPDLPTAPATPVGAARVETGAATVVATGAQGRFNPAVPVRLLDTRPSGPLGAGGTLRVRVAGVAGVPAHASGAVLNLTATGAAGAGFLTAYPCGHALPDASNVNFTPGRDVPNLVSVAIGDGGDVCVFTSATTHVLADLSGWYATGSGARFTPRTPVRVLDTRHGARGTAYEVSFGNLVSADASAVTVNVTVTQPAGDGYLTVYPCGSPLPDASNVNFKAGQDVPNLSMVRLGPGRSICMASSVPAHVIVDLAGYHSASGAALTPVAPARLLDTRFGTGGWIGWLAPNQTIDLLVAGSPGVPATASAAMLNVTATSPHGDGFLTVHPCGAPPPDASNLNYAAQRSSANLVAATIGHGGRVCLTASEPVQVIADITGYLT